MIYIAKNRKSYFSVWFIFRLILVSLLSVGTAKESGFYSLVGFIYLAIQFEVLSMFIWDYIQRNKYEF